MGLSDKYLLSPCTIMNKGSETSIALLTYFHSVPVKGFWIGCYREVAEGTERPTFHDLCLRDAMLIDLHEKS